ncbi:hypothetical protein Vretifemale_11228, partial [Volvox reticuliferus]
MADEFYREDEAVNDDTNEKKSEEKGRPPARSSRQVAMPRLMPSETLNGIDSDGVRARALAFGTKAVAVSSNKQLTSKFRGVCWNKKNKRWQAAINSSGKYLYLGSYDTEAEAAAVFDKAAVRIRGVKARLNFCYSDYVDAEGKIRDDPAIDALLNDAANPAKPRRQRGFGAATAGTAPPVAATGGAAPPQSQSKPLWARAHVRTGAPQTPPGDAPGCDTSQGPAARAARRTSGRRRRREDDSSDEAWSGQPEQPPPRQRRAQGNGQAVNGCRDSSAATASTLSSSRQSMSGSEEAGVDFDAADGGTVNGNSGGVNAGSGDRYGPTGGGGAGVARRSFGLDGKVGAESSAAAATAAAAALMGAVTAAAGLEMGVVRSGGLKDMDISLDQLGRLGHLGLGPSFHNIRGPNSSAGPKNLFLLQPLDHLSIAQKLAAGAGAAATAAVVGGDNSQPDPHSAAAAVAAAAQLQAVRRAASGLGALSSLSSGLQEPGLQVLQDQQHQQAKLAAAGIDARAMGADAAAAAAHQLRMREESFAEELEMLMNGIGGSGSGGELASGLNALHGHPLAAAAASGLPLHGLSFRLSPGGEHSSLTLAGLRNHAHGARAAGGGLSLGLGWGQGLRDGEGGGVPSGLWGQLGLGDASQSTLYALHRLRSGGCGGGVAAADEFARLLRAGGNAGSAAAAAAVGLQAPFHIAAAHPCGSNRGGTGTATGGELPSRGPLHGQAGGGGGGGGVAGSHWQHFGGLGAAALHGGAVASSGAVLQLQPTTHSLSRPPLGSGPGGHLALLLHPDPCANMTLSNMAGGDVKLSPRMGGGKGGGGMEEGSGSLAADLLDGGGGLYGSRGPATSLGEVSGRPRHHHHHHHHQQQQQHNHAQKQPHHAGIPPSQPQRQTGLPAQLQQQQQRRQEESEQPNASSPSSRQATTKSRPLAGGDVDDAGHHNAPILGFRSSHSICDPALAPHGAVATGPPRDLADAQMSGLAVTASNHYTGTGPPAGAASGGDVFSQIQGALPAGAVLDVVIPSKMANVVGVLYRIEPGPAAAGGGIDAGSGNAATGGGSGGGGGSETWAAVWNGKVQRLRQLGAFASEDRAKASCQAALAMLQDNELATAAPGAAAPGLATAGSGHAGTAVHGVDNSYGQQVQKITNSGMGPDRAASLRRNGGGVGEGAGPLLQYGACD